MGRDFSIWERYIPTSAREVYESNPETALSMEIRLLPRRDFKRYIAAWRKTEKDGIDEEALDIAAGLISANVRNVSNMIEGETLTGEEFYDYATEELLGDVTAAILNRAKLDEGLAKKLPRRSASPSSPRQSNGDGGAVNATPTLTLSAKQTQAQPILNYVTPTPKKDASEIARVRQIQASACLGSQS